MGCIGVGYVNSGLVGVYCGFGGVGFVVFVVFGFVVDKVVFV